MTEIKKNNLFFEGYSYYGNVSEFIKGEGANVGNQDWWGYDNGISNSRMVNVPNTNIVTNRNPVFTKTILGSLAEITYPTKGKTTIFYEQNKRKSTSFQPNIAINMKFKTDNDNSASTYKEKIIIKTFENDVVASLSHFISDKNHINLQIQKVGTLDPISYYYVAIPILRNSFNPTPLFTPNYTFEAQIDGCTSIVGCPAPYNCTESKSSNGLFMLQAGTYMLKISSDYNNQVDANAEINLSFYDETYPSFFYENIGGIHVAKTTDFDGQNSKTTFYDYNEQNEVPVGSIIRTLNNISSYEHRHADLSSSAIVLCDGCGTRSVTNYTSSSFNLFLSGSAKTYTEIIETSDYNDVITPIVEDKKFRFVNYDNSKIYTYIGNNFFTTKRLYPQGYKKHTHVPSADTSTNNIPGSRDLSMGRLKSEEVFAANSISSQSVLLSQKKFTYLLQTSSNLLNNPNYPASIKVIRKKLYTGCSIQNNLFEIERSIANNEFYDFHKYNDTDLEYLTESIQTKETFDNLGSIEQSTDIIYNSNHQQKIITKVDSSGNIITNELFYPYDFTDAVSTDMVAKNSIAQIVKVVNKKNGNIIDSYKYDFGSIGSNLFKPIAFTKSKFNDPLEARSVFQDDFNGNIVLIQNKTGGTTGVHPQTFGPITQVIWGYNKTQPIAKIENLEYETIPVATITDLQTKSNADNDNCTTTPCTGNEEILRVALNNLRVTFPNAMITTYTYDPLIGVTSITDPKGDQITYTYDTFNRLKWVKDKNGKILSENEYHYKN